MADFLQADKEVVPYEGDKLDLDSNDSGNWTSGSVGIGELSGTKYGVTPIDYKKFYGKQATRDDMDVLTEDKARQIRKALYWDTIHGDDINVQHFAKEIYDINLNSGGGSVPIIVGEALQEAMKNKIGLDQNTIDKLNALTNEKIIDSSSDLA